jgi:hypothetical protein
MSFPSEEGVGLLNMAVGEASWFCEALTETGDAVLEPKKKLEGSTVPACLCVSTSYIGG